MSNQGFLNYGDNFNEQISGDRDEKDTAFLNKFIKKSDERFIKTYETKQEGGMENSNFETEKYKKLKEKYGDEFSSNARSNYFSTDGGVNVASADTGYDNYLKGSYGFDTNARMYKDMPPYYRQILRDSYRDDVESGQYKEGSLLNQAEPKEEKGNILQRIAGSIFDAATFTQPAAANVLDGKIDFGSAVRAIGNLPSDYKATEQAAFNAAENFRNAVSGISNLPSDYKSTEAAAFRGAENFRRQVAEDKKIQGIIDRNPRLTRSADGSVKAVQQTRAQAGVSARTAQGNRARVKANAQARAKASAVNRRKKKNQNK